MYIFIIDLSVEGHLDCFHFLVIVTKKAMTMVEQLSVEYEVSGQMLRSDIVGSYSRPFFFSFWVVSHIDFH